MRLIVSELRDDMPLTYNKDTLTCSEDEEDPFPVRMEDEMLTAVTQQSQVATVAPLPSLSSRPDFQKLQTDSDGNENAFV